ncbi:MAG: hypothetical protein ACYDCJ_09600 [Gammaproteobacteria bacterium]
MIKRIRPPHIFRLSRRRVVTYLGAAALVAVPIQFMLGASPWIVVLAMIIITLGLLSFAIFGAYNLGTWLALFYVLGNVLVALYAKTLMGQPLDSHLYAPLDSFLVLTITTSALFVALIVARYVKLGRPLLRPTHKPKTLAWLSWGSFVLGVVFWFTNQYFQGPNGTGFGGLAVFRDLILMAVIARTALLLDKGQGSRAMDVKLALILTVAVFLGLLSNSKTYAAYPVVSYFATLLFFRRGLAWRQIILLALGLVFFVAVLVPMIQAWRYLGEQQLTVAERIALIAKGSGAVLAGGKLGRYRELADIQFHGGYYNYFGGNGRGQTLLGRYASVQQIDPVIAQVNRQGAIGGSVIWPALTRLLPKFIDPNKPKYIEGYHIIVALGLINLAGGKYPDVPLAAQVYAGYGMMGILLIPFITFTGFLLVLKKVGWNLYRNVYAIFVFCDFIIVYGNDGDLVAYWGFVLRNLPLFMLTFWALDRFSRIRWRRRFLLQPKKI